MDPQTVQLLSLALEAPLQRDRWNEFLDTFTDHLDATLIACVAVDPDDEHRSVIFESKFIRERSADFWDRYLHGEGVDDAEGIKALQRRPLGRLYPEAELFHTSPDALPPNRWRDFIRRNYGIHYRAGIAVNGYVDRRDLFFLNFPARRNPAEPALRRMVDVFAPVMSKSLRLFRIFEALRARFHAALGALDRLGLGAVLMVEDGQVVLANEAAQAMLDEADGLQLDPTGRLTASSEEFVPALRRAVADMWSTARFAGWNAETAFAINRPSGSPPYLMSLGPMVDSVGELERGLGCVVAFVADPARRTPISVKGLQLAGDLTEAETEVCRLLVNGSSTEEISERRNVSPDTVRKQVKAVMAKLGCSSRLDLVRLAFHTRLPIIET